MLDATGDGGAGDAIVDEKPMHPAAKDVSASSSISTRRSTQWREGECRVEEMLALGAERVRRCLPLLPSLPTSASAKRYSTVME